MDKKDIKKIIIEDSELINYADKMKDAKKDCPTLFFRHPKLNDSQKRKSCYRIEHTLDGVRIWMLN